MLYNKPLLNSYSTSDIIEEIGPCQNQYTTTTFYTSTGNASSNVDGQVPSSGIPQTNLNLTIGDAAAGISMRSVAGFDISSIPSGSTIASATLRVYQYSISGTPYTLLGTIVVDHVNFGSSIDTTDYSGGTLSSNIGTISNNTTIEYKTLDVASNVQTDLNDGRTSSQYRLRFTTETAPGDNNLANFETAENFGGSGNRPELVVTYR